MSTIRFTRGNVIRQGAWSIASSVASFTATLAPTAGLALRTGPDVVASVTLALWQTIVLAAIASFGIPTMIGTLAARETTATSWPVRSSVSALLWTHLSVTFVLAVAATGLGVVTLPAGIGAAFGFVALALSHTSQMTANNLLGGRFRNDVVFLVNALAAVAMCGAVAFFPVETPADALVALGCGSLVRPLACLMLIRSDHAVRGVRHAFEGLRRQWITAYLFVLTGVFAFQRLEVAFLERRATDVDVAQFGIGFDVAQVVRGAAGSTFAVLLPILAHGLREDPTAAPDRALRISKYAVGGIALVGAVLGIAIAIGPVQFGDEAPTPAVVALLVGAAAALAGGSIFGTLLTAALRIDVYLLGTIVTLVASLALNWWFTDDVRSAATVNFVSAVVFLAVQIVLGYRTLASARPGWQVAVLVLPLVLVAGTALVLWDA